MWMPPVSPKQHDTLTCNVLLAPSWQRASHLFKTLEVLKHHFSPLLHGGHCPFSIIGSVRQGALFAGEDEQAVPHPHSTAPLPYLAGDRANRNCSGTGHPHYCAGCLVFHQVIELLVSLARAIHCRRRPVLVLAFGMPFQPDLSTRICLALLSWLDWTGGKLKFKEKVKIVDRR